MPASLPPMATSFMVDPSVRVRSVRVRDDDVVSFGARVGIERESHSDADDQADELHPDERGSGLGRNAGERVGEDPADGDEDGRADEGEDMFWVRPSDKEIRRVASYL